MNKNIPPSHVAVIGMLGIVVILFGLFAIHIGVGLVGLGAFFMLVSFFVEELRESLHGDIKWDSAEGLLKFISERDWEGQYSWHADETKEFVEKAKAYLREIVSK